MGKLAWVLWPLALAAAWVAVQALRGRLPPRPVLNAWSSLLLLAYLAVTAGLGIFWVAQQHLPVFDWHYLFGYALVALVLLHLGFNLRALLGHLRRRPLPPAAARGGRRPLIGGLGLLGLAAVGGLGYLLGLRQGRTQWQLPASASAEAGGAVAAAQAVVEQFHATSSLSRAAALRRAPSAGWGEAPPPFKAVVSDRVLALPQPRGGAAATGTMDAALLGDLLWHIAGVNLVRGGIHFRTAPSSGALFATELYVAVRHVQGVEPGVWHYDPLAHRLQRVSAAVPDGALLGLPGLPWPDAAAAAVVATAVFRRSERKYGDRAYRYVLADLGHALHNLRAAAAARGATVALRPAFDGAAVAEALAVDEAEEGVLMVAPVGARVVSQLGATAGEPGAPAPAEAPPHGWAVPPLQAAKPAAAPSVTQAVHRATSLRWAGAAVPAVPPALRAPPPPPPAEVLPAPPHLLKALPPVVPGPADALALIAARRSRRRFDAAPLALPDVAALLAAAATDPAVAAAAGGPPPLSAAVRVDLLSLAVQGLAVGAWRYHPAHHALTPRPVPSDGLRERARRAALDQDVVGDAAAVLVMSMDRAVAAADPAGPARGWRHAFLQAGLAGERVYLEGGARGLAVCAVGAFYDDEAARLLGVEPAHEWVLHFVALGRPAAGA